MVQLAAWLSKHPKDRAASSYTSSEAASQIIPSSCGLQQRQPGIDVNSIAFTSSSMSLWSTTSWLVLGSLSSSGVTKHHPHQKKCHCHPPPQFATLQCRIRAQMDSEGSARQMQTGFMHCYMIPIGEPSNFIVEESRQCELRQSGTLDSPQKRHCLDWYLSANLTIWRGRAS